MSEICSLMYDLWWIVWCPMSDVRYLMSVCVICDVWCLLSDVWCPMSDLRYLMSDIRRLMSAIFLLMSHVQCLLSYVWCLILMSYVYFGCLMSDVLCLMSDVRCSMSDLRRLISYIPWGPMSNVRCLISYVWCLPLKRKLRFQGPKMQIFENGPKNWVFVIPTYSFREERQKRRFWNSIASHSASAFWCGRAKKDWNKLRVDTYFIEKVQKSLFLKMSGQVRTRSQCKLPTLAA